MEISSGLFYRKRSVIKGDYLHYLDSLLVMLNISTYCSVVPYVLFQQYQRGWCILFISIINIFYLFVRFHNKIKVPSDFLFLIFVCVLSSNVLAVLSTGDKSNVAFLYPILNTTFYILLFSLYSEYIQTESKKQSIWLVARGYIWLCVWGIISALSLFFLIKAGFDPTTTPVADEYYDLFKSNSDSSIRTYYFPYHISVLLEAGIITKKIPFFMDYGIICGLFHEPNAICFVVFPALFILWFYEEKKSLRILYLFIWLFVILLTASTTNILSFSFSIVILMMLEKKFRKWLIPIGFISIYLILYIGLENTDMVFILDKLEDTDGSRSYSSGTIEFAFTPLTLLGSNFLSNSYLTEISSAGTRDVGFLSFILNIVFLSLFIYRLVRLVLVYKEYRLLGIAALYFFLHSMKTAMVTYTNPILLLIMLIMFVVEKTKKSEHLGYNDTAKNSF